MPSLPIITGRDTPILRNGTKRVPNVTKEILKMLKDMAETAEKEDGMGIAAPQVGLTHRMCIARLGGKLTPVINPVILKRGTETVTAEEGCLSLPGVWLQVTRATMIVLRYNDAKGNERERVFEGMDARVLQHEIDHLDGRLIVDYAKSEMDSFSRHSND